MKAKWLLGLLVVGVAVSALPLIEIVGVLAAVIHNKRTRLGHGAE